MDKWGVLGQAFENLGMNLRTDCENLGTSCQVDSRFESLYPLYAMMLDTLKLQIRLLNARFDVIDTGHTDFM